MKRRYIALIAIAVPVIVVAILKYVHPISYKWIMGYMVAVALIFKGSILSLWFATKLKMLSFLKGLTLIQGISLLIKRWFLDNVLATWVKEHIIDHLIEGVITSYSIHYTKLYDLHQVRDCILQGYFTKSS